MPPILNAQGLSKSYGAAPLFQNVSLIIAERDRIGLIGPNGSGKSTLLQILAGRLEPDAGEIALRKRTRLSYVAQESVFPPGLTIRSVIKRALERASVAPNERENRLAETLGRAGFEDFDTDVSSLSGGWQKRLAIVEALVEGSDILLLDEPTNHLDLAGIEWLEALLANANFACVVVSHDRYFLENVAGSMAELNRAYPDGLLRVSGNYSAFLEKKEEFLHAQSRHQEALENRVRNEIEWLRRGPKARATKAKARIQKANELISELADLNARTRTATADIDFSGTERQTKRLIELNQVSYAVGGRVLFDDLDFIITAGMHVGLLGPNGSGKTTLLRLIRGEASPTVGEIRRAGSLQIVYFDQNRQLDPDQTLRRALAPDSDSVIYQGRVIHVASWAARFLFTSEQLNQPVGRLSGGERARVLIANLMLQPADVLLLDEPTNDLDIPTLEILEESLLEYRGALVLVTHDRYLLDRVSGLILGLDGQGGSGVFADYSQWEIWQAASLKAAKDQRDGEPAPVASQAGQREVSSRAEPQRSEGGVEGPGVSSSSTTKTGVRKKLSYLEAREYGTLEQRIADAEQILQARRAALEDPAIVTDAPRILAAQAELEQAQKAVDDLYARWAELEEKQG